eukprot:COSAG01_NODE_2144_length_8312_cov_22.048843_9_plen_83_part_00
MLMYFCRRCGIILGVLRSHTLGPRERVFIFATLPRLLRNLIVWQQQHLVATQVLLRGRTSTPGLGEQATAHPTQHEATVHSE